MIVFRQPVHILYILYTLEVTSYKRVVAPKGHEISKTRAATQNPLPTSMIDNSNKNNNNNNNKEQLLEGGHKEGGGGKPMVTENVIPQLYHRTPAELLLK